MSDATMYDAIIVLGAQVRPDGVASEALKRRMTLAHDRYQQGPQVPIICCGARGKDEPVAEGDFMCAWLHEKGIPAEHLISENASYDTLENIQNAKAIMLANGMQSALVVTSDYHVPRALAICRRHGVKAQGAGSPSLRSYWLKNHLRELLAWGKFFLTWRP